ncbi:MAG: methylenetetrahydrofolate reductase C-terminal domain-containing protein [Acidobacteria bacterium]|nr:methylenetetrahydrofolate reductase C-terminal domain-containing protein [Acidobacteriota bacterium]
MYKDLREGWISRHASILIVELNEIENTHRILSDENLETGIVNYFLKEGSESPFQSAGALLPRLSEIIAEKLKSRENRLKNALQEPGGFCTIWEQIPGPGAFEKRQAAVLENARKAARRGIACAISITDNPGGNPAIATDILCAEIRKAGIDPLVHIAFRDRSRNQAESLLFQLAALDINNILVLTGDYPSDLGYAGKSKPVFDLDSVNGLRLVKEMNRGLMRTIMRKPTRLGSTDFFAGVAFSPFKQMEAEVMGQFYKMKKKVEAGADFVITQVGYDARKLHEFLMWLNERQYRIPALAGIYVLSYQVAKAMHNNHVPGCVVTEEMLRQLATESESSDKGRQARLNRAAKMYAIVKGLGFRGAYISGQNMPVESLEYIVTKGNELAGDWRSLIPEFNYPQENGFYFFKQDPETGLNSTVQALKNQAPDRPLIYEVSRASHRLFFEPDSGLFKPLQKFMRRVDASPFLYRLLHSFERWIKSLLYGCKDCGDCALFDAAYLCPVSQCPKDQRNAPCGGSYQGWCEVYPNEKQCIWVQAYVRLKSRGKEDEIGGDIVPPCNWDLWQSSSWINYFLGRDHSAQMRGIRQPDSGSADPSVKKD